MLQPTGPRFTDPTPNSDSHLSEGCIHTRSTNRAGLVQTQPSRSSTEFCVITSTSHRTSRKTCRGGARLAGSRIRISTPALSTVLCTSIVVSSLLAEFHAFSICHEILCIKCTRKGSEWTIVGATFFWRAADESKALRGHVGVWKRRLAASC
jgi:hypothetical protein